MTAPPLFHGTFEISRQWKATPQRVFSLWADPALKSQWFRGPPGLWTETRRSMDFRVGGMDVTEGHFGEGGLTTLFQARYHVIEPDSRLVYVFDLHMSGVMHSVTLCSLGLMPEGDTTHVSYSEKIVFMDRQDGVEMRRAGTEWQFDVIEEMLRSNGSAR
jgi:uncharacterized protein YndB with AHSA1/START domain